MNKKEKFIIVEYKNIELKMKDAIGLRGFFADIDQSDTVMHNHELDGRCIYRYPEVQYKVLHNHPYIVVFGDGIRSFYPKVMEVQTLTIGKNTYHNPDMHISLSTKPIGDCRNVNHYRFITPWLGLNQHNYKKYIKIESEEEKEKFLHRILIGNILSMCKEFKVNIENQLMITSDLKTIPVHYKKEKMIGFSGEFSVNCNLPSLCGMGKGVSIGYGTIVQNIKQEGEKEGNEDKCMIEN